jgi:hypothetical protein
MNSSRFTRCVRTTLTFLVLWGCRQIQRLIQGSKTLPGIVARELWRPSTHYRIALVLVAVLALLLSWSLAFPHAAMSAF